MFDTSNFRKGLRVEINNQPYIMLDVEFVKPGKGQAFTRVKLKNMISNLVLDKTYKSGEKLSPADILDRDMQFLYQTDGVFHFMDNSNYEQFEMSQDQLEDNWKWLVDGMTVTVTIYNGRPVGIILPNFSTLQIQECAPGLKGDTVTNTTKPAKLQTGANIQVPLFVEQGEYIRVDTRSGLYMDRVKK